jgi:cellulose synthase/poly-beta-1,6-N-acetylglucosamine synthase-like glycosyltransferase
MQIWTVTDLLVWSVNLVTVPFFGLMLITSSAALYRAIVRSRTGNPVKSSPPPARRFVVVVPAHDEESGIIATVTSCKSLNYPEHLFQVVVVADNCTDATADRARDAGARVLERHDSSKRGKGYAIQYLIDSLIQAKEFDLLDALVFIDADSTVHPDLLRRFAQNLDSGDDWIQCYDAVGNADQSWRTRLMAYAFSLINGVTLQGQSALGLSAGFRGNGMCISTAGLRRVPWSSQGLTEDLEYSWSVRIAGGRIAFAPEVSVLATMLTRGGEASTNQRRRWEYGRDKVRRAMLGPLLRSPHLGWNQKTAAVIELTMPAMVTLVAAYLILVISAILRARVLAATQEYFFLYSIAFCLAIASLALGLHALCPFLLGLLPWRFANSLIYLPYYAIWKSLVSWRGRPHSWLRTTREHTERDDSPRDRAASFPTPHVMNDSCHLETLELPHQVPERAE